MRSGIRRGFAMSLRFAAVLAVAVGVMVVPVESAWAEPVSIGASSPSVFTGVRPCRLADTRIDRPGRLQPQIPADIQVTDRCNVPSDATAVALVLTAVSASEPGFVTAWPAGLPRPLASALNYRSGEVRANSALVQLGQSGAVSVVSSAAVDVVVDVSGYFVAAAGPVASGRFVPLTPHRLVDTRQTARPGPFGVVRVKPDVPIGATAVAINVTTTDTVGPDVFVAYPAASDPPLASMLNADGAGQTRAASTIVGLGDGMFDVATRFGNHVIVDITGYFTGPSASPSTDGRFVATVPTRLVDTRDRLGVDGGPRLHDGGGREFSTAAVTGGPTAAVAVNWTITETEDRGWLVGYPAGTSFGEVSTINADAANLTVANSSISPVSTRGLAVHASQGTQLVVDVTGWFTGTPLPASSDVIPDNQPPTRRVTIISDSAMAGVRWNGALGGLQGSVFDARLESCRRLVQLSCRGREGTIPPTAAAEIAMLATPGSNDLLVIAVGYNDWHGRFSQDFDVVMAAARAKGFHHIAWVTYRSSVGYQLPGTSDHSNYSEMNRVLREQTASGRFSEVRLWNLDAYAANATSWFAADGVHETTLGSWGVADWLSRHVAAYDGRPCRQPWTKGGPTDAVCPNPDPLAATLGLPGIAGLYPSAGS